MADAIDTCHPAALLAVAERAVTDEARYALRDAAREIERLRAALDEHDRCARAVWEPRATPEDRTFWAEFGSEAGAAYGLPPSEPGAAWIVGRLGSMLDEARADAKRARSAAEAMAAALSSIDYALGPVNDHGVSLYDVDRDEERVVRRVLDIVARARAVIDAPLLVDAGTEMIEAVRALARVLGEPEPGEGKP